MLEIFVFPVSAIMKAWHLLLHNGFGIDAPTAWVVSIFCLVITVRALLTPFTWVMKRSGRRSVLMRPELAELEQRYGSSTDPQDVVAYTKAKKDLYEKYNYNLAAGCIPPLIQLPIILGLYRLLIWMARPGVREGSIGLLSEADIASFQQATIGAVPVQAFIAMSDERLFELGTTAAEVRSFTIPLLLAAVFFTTLNMVLSIWWSYRHVQWESGLSRGLLRFMTVLAILTPALLLTLGLFGPIPVALILYWFLGNLWTLTQTIVMNTILLRRYPETDTHTRLRAEGKEEYVRAKRQRRADVRADRERRQAIRTAPAAERATLQAEYNEAKAQAQRAAEETKKRRSEQRKAQQKIRAQYRAHEARQRKAEKRAGKRDEDPPAEDS